MKSTYSLFGNPLSRAFSRSNAPQTLKAWSYNTPLLC